MQEKSTPTSTMTSEPEAAALAIIRLDGFCLCDGFLPRRADHLCVRMELSDSKRAAILGLTSASLLGIKSE
jgi:hypothetical protein